MIKAGIIGDDLYAIGELLRLAYNHPDVRIIFIDSEEHDNRPIADAYKWITWANGETFTNCSPLDTVDVLFCCFKAKAAMDNFMRITALPHELKVIDLSPANRLAGEGSGFVYGLPELNRRATCSARFVASPSEMGTAAILALLPLAKNLLLGKDITINIIAGTSCFRNAAPGIKPMSPALPFDHDTANEIRKAMLAKQNSFDADIVTLPVMSQNKRGIIAVASTEVNVKIEDVKQIYNDYYKEDSFTFLVDDASLEYVLGTNKCFLRIDMEGKRIAITSCIDNIMKGCAGQAIHNMNLLFNLEETTGLNHIAMLL